MEAAGRVAAEARGDQLRYLKDVSHSEDGGAEGAPQQMD